MDALLSAMEAALVAGSYRVEVVADADSLPESRSLPVITLADGGFSLEEDGLNESTGVLTVVVGLYYAVTDGAKTVLGSGHRAGLEVMARDVRTILNDNLLGLADYEHAWLGGEGPAQYFGTERDVFARKQQTYEYRRVET